jgi:hypothetical protein
MANLWKQVASRVVFAITLAASATFLQSCHFEAEGKVTA